MCMNTHRRLLQKHSLIMTYALTYLPLCRTCLGPLQYEYKNMRKARNPYQCYKNIIQIISCPLNEKPKVLPSYYGNCRSSIFPLMNKIWDKF